MTIRRREPKNIEECENPDCTGCAYCDAMGWTRRSRKKNPMAKKKVKVGKVRPKTKTRGKKKRLSHPSKSRVQKRRTPKITVRFASPIVATFARHNQRSFVTALQHHVKGLSPHPAGIRSAIVGFYTIKGRVVTFTTEVGKRLTTIAFV